MFEKILNHKNIEVILNTDYKSILDSIKFDKMIYTGPIDYFFDYKYGKLQYSSIKFKFENIKQKQFQESAQINYVDDSVDYTRAIEHKLLNQQNSETTTISYEFPQQDGEPYYPIPTEENRAQYHLYKKESEKLSNIIFCGRLAEYQYYNMDQVVASTLNIFRILEK
jgi:UDP-galactopyranose mutase